MKNKLSLSIILSSIILFSPITVLAEKEINQKKDIAIQLYSVRDLIGSYGNYNSDYTIVLQKLAQMGYTAVEAAGYDDGKFYDKTPKQFRHDVEVTGMEVLSSHCTKGLSPEELASGDFTESLKWWDTAIKAHREAGMTYIITPWLDVPKTINELKIYCNYYNEIG